MSFAMNPIREISQATYARRCLSQMDKCHRAFRRRKRSIPRLGLTKGDSQTPSLSRRAPFHIFGPSNRSVRQLDCDDYPDLLTRISALTVQGSKIAKAKAVATQNMTRTRMFFCRISQSPTPPCFAFNIDCSIHFTVTKEFNNFIIHPTTNHDHQRIRFSRMEKAISSVRRFLQSDIPDSQYRQTFKRLIDPSKDLFGRVLRDSQETDKQCSQHARSFWPAWVACVAFSYT